MTSFGTDRSHHNGRLNADLLKGLQFHTHKLTDGDHYFEDSAYKTATEYARSLNVPILGSYHVLWGNRNLTSQADWWIQRVTALTPYWRSVPYVWQSDCEGFGYNGVPTIDQINTFGDLVCSRANIPAERYIAYAPAWVYGAGLSRLRYMNWGSNYGSNPAIDYRAAYPGDNSSRWQVKANGVVVKVNMPFLQYGSATNIQDANAYRGTLEQLLVLIKAPGSTPAPEGDMIIRVNEDGAIWTADAARTWRRTVNSLPELDSFGIPENQWKKIPRSQLPWYGKDVSSTQGPKGDPGADGKDGKDGVGFAPGQTVTITGPVEVENDNI